MQTVHRVKCVETAGLHQHRLVVREPVDLVLPFGVAPFVSRFGQRAVPGRMEVRIAKKGGKMVGRKKCAKKENGGEMKNKFFGKSNLMIIR